MFYRYRLGSLRAQGAQSNVYDAYDAFQTQKCIVKIGPHAKDEALLALELNHPSILSPNDCGLDHTQGPYAVYPVANGKSLREAWKHASDRERRKFVLQISDFLAFLHSKGWLYTDFKPEHFFVEENSLQVVDLGLCTPLSLGVSGSKTYCGTYPFIAPERVTGRLFDQRSDLYSLGIMLLDLFQPISVQPGGRTFLPPARITQRLAKIKGVWKHLIRDLAAPEPSQRPHSALELRSLLLPKRVRETPLFFNVPGSAQIPEPLRCKRGITVIFSPSQINLDHTERQIIGDAWRRSAQLIRIDFSRYPLSLAFARLTDTLVQRQETDLLAAVSALNQYSGGDCFLIFRNINLLSADETALFCYGLTCLSRQTEFHIYLLTQELSAPFKDEDWYSWQPPPYIARNIPEILSSICPPHGINISGDLQRSGTVLPEQIMGQLQQKLHSVPSQWWPIAAWNYRMQASFESLKPHEKRVLLEVALNPECTFRHSRDTLSKLVGLGWLRKTEEVYQLTAPSREILKRFRKNPIQRVAKRLLPMAKHNKNPTVIYNLARILNNRKLSAASALEAAARFEALEPDAASEWMWRAFRNGHSPDSAWTFKMIRHSLHRMQLHRTRKLIEFHRSCHGNSFALADRSLDLLHRRNQLERAAEHALHLAQVAKQKGFARLEQYFGLRHAGFLILANHLGDGETALTRRNAMNDETPPRIAGLIHHFTGLLCLQKGNVHEAIVQLKTACAIPHRFRATSYMNLGIAEAYAGNQAGYGDCMQKAITIFTRSQDLMRLSFAYNNLGIYFKRNGDLIKARDNYFKAIHLSRAGRTPYILAASLDNLATTFAMEGRTERAIEYYMKAISIAKKAKLKEREAASLTNAGLQYAYKGHFQRAIACGRRALRLRKQLGMTLAIADTQESLGLIFLLLRQNRKSALSFTEAQKIYSESGLSRDEIRVELYKQLLKFEEGSSTNEILIQEKSLPEDSFENGLLSYVRACASKKSRDANMPKIIQDLNKAEAIFRKVPALFWVAQTLEEKAYCHLNTGNYEKALLCAGAANDIYDRMEVAQKMKTFAKGDLNGIPQDFVEKMAEKMPFQVLTMIREVLREKDIDRMVERILTTALEFTGMERAVLILEQGSPIVYKSTALDAETIREIREISHTAMAAASHSAKPFLCHNASMESLVKSQPSIIGNQITSIACLPLNDGDQLLGFLYLDSREGVDSLAAMESVLLEIFASVVAIALRTGLLLQDSAKEIEGLKESLCKSVATPEIIAQSSIMLDALKNAHRLIPTDLPVLITGETGTGKEAIARLLHFEGKRKNGPFVAVNGSAFTDTLLESELFGHEKGSFTGATSQKKGMFEEAKGGTLFIDEIAELSAGMQSKLLRVLQEGEFRRVGGSATLKTDVRVIAATNKNLIDLNKQKRFREDLYYRIRGAQIHLPALRERTEDIAPLALHFLKNAAASARKKIRGMRPEAFTILKRYAWPGNVRELRNEMERVAAMSENEWIVPEDFDPQILTEVNDTDRSSIEMPTLRELEKQSILRRLERTGWNIHQTARSLGITRNGLYGKMTQYSIPRKRPPDLQL